MVRDPSGPFVERRTLGPDTFVPSIVDPAIDRTVRLANPVAATATIEHFDTSTKVDERGFAGAWTHPLIGRSNRPSVRPVHQKRFRRVDGSRAGRRRRLAGGALRRHSAACRGNDAAPYEAASIRNILASNSVELGRAVRAAGSDPRGHRQSHVRPIGVICLKLRPQRTMYPRHPIVALRATACNRLSRSASTVAGRCKVTPVVVISGDLARAVRLRPTGPLVCVRYEIEPFDQQQHLRRGAFQR